jgi:acyl-CoA thioesterase FadM
VTLPDPPPPTVVEAASVHSTRIEVRARDLDAAGHVDPAVLFTFLEEARAAWLGGRLPDAVVTHVAVGYRRPLGRAPVTVTCMLDAVGRASFRTRETVADAKGVAVEAATTLEVPGRALAAAERDELRAPARG